MNSAEPYQEILDVMEKNKDAIKARRSIDIRSRIKDLIKMFAVFSEFSICVEDRQEASGGTYYKISEYQFIGLYGEDHRRTVSWLDDGEQPENEWLYCFSFSTGAYIFGQDYPMKTFNGFFNKLKSYEPKYCDSNNHSMYFSKENAAAVHDDFKSIMDEYREVAKAEFKKNRAKKLREELTHLEASQ